MIESIREQLQCELPGTLHCNIAPPTSFTGWNTVIGEGDASEAAQDVLASVQLRGYGSDGFLTELPFVIAARDGKGKVIGTRSVRSILAPYAGTVSSVPWLRNATCAGKQVKRTTVNLACGE